MRVHYQWSRSVDHLFLSLTCLRSYHSAHGCPDPQCSGAGAEPSFGTSVSPVGSSDAEEEAARRLYKHLAADGCLLWYKGKCCPLTATVLYFYLKTFIVLDCHVFDSFRIAKADALPCTWLLRRLTLSFCVFSWTSRILFPWSMPRWDNIIMMSNNVVHARS